jgi:hypothetical protein
VLSTKHSISLAKARAALAKTQKREEPEQRTVSTAEFGKNTKTHAASLYLAIAGANDIKSNIAHNSSYVLPFGFPSDLDVTEAMFGHLVQQMVAEANAYIKSGEYKVETTRRWVRRKNYMTADEAEEAWAPLSDDKGWYEWQDQLVEKPIDGRIARSNFYEAFVSRIQRRLNEARRQTEAEVMAEDTTTGTELALIEKREEVSDYYKKNSRARGSWKGSSTSAYSGSARSAGDAAGSRASLAQGGSIGGKKALGS